MFTFLFLYSLIVLVLFVGGFFIVYHILRYSLARSLGYFGATLFGIIFLFLLTINFLSFQSLEANSLLPVIETDSLLELPIPTATSATRNSW